MSSKYRVNISIAAVSDIAFSAISARIEFVTYLANYANTYYSV